MRPEQEETKIKKKWNNEREKKLKNSNQQYLLLYVMFISIGKRNTILAEFSQ